jgi:hypothetical protein
VEKKSISGLNVNQSGTYNLQQLNSNVMASSKMLQNDWRTIFLLSLEDQGDRK